jgi:outer membrane receptor protein involved in Fe transport
MKTVAFSRSAYLMIATSVLAISFPVLSAPACAATDPRSGPDNQAPQADSPAQDNSSIASSASSAGNSDDQDIVVTGSRIPRPNLDTGQPTIVIDSKLVDQRGYTNIADALKAIPSFGVPGSSRVGGQAGSFGSGQNFVDFFGLGSQRTLTLINGRRFVSSNSASIFGPTDPGVQVDFNVIPTILLDRVETIAVGGAPIYGSDAIAGTINVITKRKFTGIQLDTQYGVSERGDGRDYRVRGLAGFNFADGRGNIMIACEYNQ